VLATKAWLEFFQSETLTTKQLMKSQLRCACCLQGAATIYALQHNPQAEDFFEYSIQIFETVKTLGLHTPELDNYIAVAKTNLSTPFKL
jgi:hypothetical protein